MMPRLQYVIEKEELIKFFLLKLNKNLSLFSVNIDQEGKKAILQLANGDMRRALNILQVFEKTLKN